MHIQLMDGGLAGARGQTAGLAAAVSGLCGGAEVVAREVRGAAWTTVFPRLAARFARFDSSPTRILPQSDSHFSPTEISPPSGSDSSPTEISPQSDYENSSPDMVIACGHRAAWAAVAMRRRGAFVVFVQKPPLSVSAFDAVICPMHDEIRGENVLPILGSVGGVRAKDLQNRRARAGSKFADLPSPRTALLIGGESRAYRMPPSFCGELAKSVRRADLSGGVLATVSRRTGAENARALQNALADGGCFVHCGAGENPYMDILAAADRFVVSADSVNMLSEAAAAGKPLWFAEPPQKSSRAAGKFRRFHNALAERKLARRWAGAFTDFPPAPPLDETARAAEFVWRRYCESRNRKSGGGKHKT